MTCPHCKTEGKTTSKYRGRFRRRYLEQKKCQTPEAIAAAQVRHDGAKR